MQDISLINIHPLDLSRFGKTPQGKPVYRVVWADSRIEKAEYEGRMYDVPLYTDKAAGKWILEKWLPADRFAGTREAFEKSCRDMGVNMEYPADGEYELSAIFPGEVVPELAYFWAGGINYDQANHTPAERARALREAYALSQKQAGEKKEELIHNITERINA